MNAPDSWIAFNEASGVDDDGGFGGGLQIVGGARESCANIGSPGVGGAGPIYANQARYGGGISLIGANDTDNTASLGLLQHRCEPPGRPFATTMPASAAAVSSSGPGVNSGTATAGSFSRAVLRNASLIDNCRAGRRCGLRNEPPTRRLFRASASLDINRSGFFCELAVEALPCPAGRACSTISGQQWTRT